MSVYVIDTIKPKNGLDFAVVEAVDVAVEGYLNLADAVTHFATQSALAELTAAINGKADTADLTAAVTSLQGQINQIEISASAEAVVAPEVAAARVSENGTEYTTLKERLDTENENLNTAVNQLVTSSIDLGDSQDVITLLGSTSFAYGLRDGYWGPDGARQTSSHWLMTSAKIRAFETSSYSDFFKDCAYGSVTLPTLNPDPIIICRIRAWDQNSVLVQQIDVQSGEKFPIIPDCLYGISIKFDDDYDPSTYLTQQFASAFIISKYVNKTIRLESEIEEAKDDIDALKNVEIIENTVDWLGLNTTSSTVHNWRVGYYRSDTGALDTSTKYLSSGKFKVAAGKGFEGVEKLSITVPDDYGVRVFEWDETNTLVATYGKFNTTDPDYTSSVSVEIKSDYTYAFSVGRWADDDARDYLTDEFIGTIVLKLYGKSAYLTNIDTYIRFNVNTNLTWCNVDSDSEESQETTDMQSIRCILRLPSTYTVDGRPVPIILFGHGAGGYISDTIWYSNATTSATGGNHLKLMDAFVQAGYAIFDVSNTRNDSGGWSDWGCTPLMSAYAKALDYIRMNYNVDSNRVFLLSESMGTVVNLNYMRWYQGEVAASICLAPRPICSLRYETNDAEHRRKMEAAFGITTEDEWDFDRLKSFDHYENIVTIGETPMILDRFAPMKVLVGTSDTSFLTEVREYFEAAKNSGNYINYREVAGADHGDMCTLRTPYSDIMNECINWFNRFR